MGMRLPSPRGALALWGMPAVLLAPIFAAGLAPIFAQDAGLAVKRPAVAEAKVASSDTTKKTLAHGKAAKPTGPPAKELFGAVKTPAPIAPSAIGFYARGCLAGAAELPSDGVAWQAMRLSRNRNWGHPALVALVEKLAIDAREHDGWPGLLVGDISQPRGGPMASGHASHQVGLDADIWLTPMPDRRLTAQEREDLSATSMLAEDQVSVDRRVFTDAHVRLLKRAASYPSVERIFVHPAIKQALCEATAHDSEHHWLNKVRAYWGHNDHFHVRIACPKGSGTCEAQPPLPSDDGCGAELTRWLARVKPKPPAPQPRPKVAQVKKPELTLNQLPLECRRVLAKAPGGVAIPAPTVAATKAPSSVPPAKSPQASGTTPQ
jgi:penicillin-insensitive murein DD-endopeptidase